MLIVVCGKNEAAFLTMTTLDNIFENAEIKFVYNLKDKFSRNEQSLSLCEEKGWETIAISSQNDLRDLVRSKKPDWIVSAQFSIIFNPEFLEENNRRVVNLHFSPLPKYRGVAPITNAILNGETEFGVSLHFVDKGIDTGDIIDVDRFSIQGLNNYQVYDLCNQALPRILERNKQFFLDPKSVIVNKQDSSMASYYSATMTNYKLLEIDFNLPAKKIVTNWLARYFPPFEPYFLFRNKKQDLIKVIPKNKPVPVKALFRSAPGKFVRSPFGSTVYVSTADYWIKFQARIENNEQEILA